MGLLWRGYGLAMAWLWAGYGVAMGCSSWNDCKKMQKKCKKMHYSIAYMKKKQYLCSGFQ